MKKPSTPSPAAVARLLARLFVVVACMLAAFVLPVGVLVAGLAAGDLSTLVLLAVLVPMVLGAYSTARDYLAPDAH